jgi:photosystem II stability/assembly factor-like uncharacterized protein
MSISIAVLIASVTKTNPITKNLLSVFFINNQNGYIVGNSGTILKTTNGYFQGHLK